MALSWAAQRKLQYTMGFSVVILLLIGYPLYTVLHSVFYQVPTCFDGKQNQDERDVDCGGVCTRPCVGETQDLEVMWSGALAVTEGYYDIAAKVNNPNARAGLKSFEYVFKVYDKSDTLLYEKEGTSYADAGERFLVYQPNVFLDESVPSRVELEIKTPLDWVTKDVKTSTLRIGKKELLHTGVGSRLNALIQNDAIIGSYTDVDVYAVVSDITGRPVGISQTYIKDLVAGDSKNIFFTWPISLKEQTKGLCENRASLPTELLVPSDVVLVFDRSGSMNFISKEPPQPLTDAKEAAKEFANRMLSVDRAGLVSFAAEASFPIDQSLTNDSEELKRSINNISIGIPNNEQHTNLGDGIKKALEELQKNGREKAKKAIVALTDGVATRPLDPINPSNTSYAESYAALEANQAEQDDVLLYVIGLGKDSDLNTELLQQDIASDPEKFYHAKNASELSRIYNDIAKAVCEEDVFLYEIYIRIPDDAE